MSKVIAIANQKGGVGKTTTTLNFGAELAARGYKVLLIDFDPQGNLTLSCGIEDADTLIDTISKPLMEIIEGKADVDLPIYSYRENIDFVPANEMLSSIKLMLVQVISRETVLKRALKKAREDYDYILIDCAPALTIDLVNALTAADEILIVTAPAKFAVSGIEGLMQTINQVRDNINDNLKIAGILINQIDQRTNFGKDTAEMMRDVWADMYVYESEIPCSIRVEESQAMGLAMGEYEKANKAAIGFSAFTDEYLRRGE